MFERFTDQARRVVVFADEEARLLHDNYIGTEHLLLGLIREGDSVAATVLTRFGMSLDLARTEVESVVGHAKTVSSGHIPFTPRAKKVLEVALREASQRGDEHIGAEHILLGLMREGKGVGVRVLERFGLTLTELRQAVIDLMPDARHADESKDSRRRYGPFRRRDD